MSCRAAPDCARPPGPHPGARRPAHLRVRHGLGRLTGSRTARTTRTTLRVARPVRAAEHNNLVAAPATIRPQAAAVPRPPRSACRPGRPARRAAAARPAPVRVPPRSACRAGRPARRAAAARQAPVRVPPLVRVPPWTSCPAGCRGAEGPVRVPPRSACRPGRPARRAAAPGAAGPGPRAALDALPGRLPRRAGVRSVPFGGLFLCGNGRGEVAGKSPGSSVPSCVKRRDFRVVSDHNAFWNRPKAVPSRNPTRGAFIV